jgi:hypothetical protein
MVAIEAVTLSYLSPYKPSSPTSITKDLESKNIRPKLYIIQHINHMLQQIHK